MPAPDPDDAVARLGGLVPAADEPEDAVLTDNARVVRWAGPLFAVLSVGLLPWIAYIAITLPARQLSPNYDIAWAGFDVLLFCGLAGTAYFALRRSLYLSSAATATATILIVDAWFDVMTSPSNERPQALLLCIVVELPLAAVCLWLSHHTLHLAERRIVLIQRRRGHMGDGRSGDSTRRASR
jgi:hypothetical protein